MLATTDTMHATPQRDTNDPYCAASQMNLGGAWFWCEDPAHRRSAGGW